RVGNDVGRAAAEVARFAGNALVVDILHARQEVGATVEEVPAEGDRRLHFLVVIALGLTVVAVDLQAVEVLEQDEVDDPGHGVGAVGGRGAPGAHVDPLNNARGDQV